MEIVIPLLAAVLTTFGVYLMMNTNMVKFLFGLILFSNAANVIIFSAGRLTVGHPPFIPKGHEVPLTDVANALPQALILTALVIGFGLLSFALVLAYRAYQEIGTLDIDDFECTDLDKTDETGDPL